MKNLSNISNMPQMGRAFGGWTSKITLIHRKEFIVDGLVQYASNSFSFNGTIQPLSPKNIELKPEGQRAWEWLQIHCFANQKNKFMQALSSSCDAPGQSSASDPEFMLGTDYSDILKDNDRIKVDKKIYKIMGILDYRRNGFIEYHLVRDYQR